MRTIFLLFLSSLVFVACGDSSGSKSSPPPKEMVGTWADDQLQAISAGPGQDTNPCDEVTVNGQTVSTNLFKVDAEGTVYDAKNITEENKLYRVLGHMDGSGQIFTNDLGRQEFLGYLADVEGAVVTPIVMTAFTIDQFKGPKFEMKIEVQFVVKDQSVKQEIGSRTYYRIGSDQEKTLLAKASTCLSKAKGKTP